MIMVSGGGLLQRRMYHISTRSRFSLDISSANGGLEDLFYELFILDEYDNTHRSQTLRSQLGW
jgi:hypothetical protein